MITARSRRRRGRLASLANDFFGGQLCKGASTDPARRLLLLNRAQVILQHFYILYFFWPISFSRCQGEILKSKK
jgi:hypothetical protein